MKYTGRLSKPIARKIIGLIGDVAPHHAEADRVSDEMLSKLPDLFEAHGVPLGNWCALVLAMAKDHVPGFKIVNPAGRKTEWDDLDKAAFKVDVDNFINQSNEKKVPVTEAIAKTQRFERWAEKTKGMKIAALSQHYYKADKRWVDWLKVRFDARKYESIVGKD